MKFDEWWEAEEVFMRAEGADDEIILGAMRSIASTAWDAAQPKWQPIDCAPLDGESVLLYYGPAYYVMEGRCFKRERGYRKNVYYQWVTAIDMGELEPTHWMPLPAAPQGDEK